VNKLELDMVKLFAAIAGFSTWAVFAYYDPSTRPVFLTFIVYNMGILTHAAFGAKGGGNDV